VRGNYQPRVTGTDDGIWRRIDIINFGVTIPPGERDTHLVEKLQAELPGILAWGVRGAAAWYAGGLQEPTEVVRATADYRASEDVLGKFLASECLFGEGTKVTATALNTALDTWCKAEVIGVPSSKALANRLHQRGLKPPTSSHGKRWWSGVCLLGYQDEG
jgi:putative DNA primase/helicase